MLELQQSSIFSRLRGLLEVARLVRTEAPLQDVLAAVARTVSESLGFRSVVINLRRREWDDFIVTTVHGSEEAKETLLGAVDGHAMWAQLLNHRFLRRGAYLVPHGELDWTEKLAYVPDAEPVPDDPNAWHPEDALFVPMRAADGTLIGILSVDEPISGRTPSGDEIDVLVAIAAHAALVVEAAQEAAEAKRHRAALERLFEVSSRLTSTSGTTELLQLVCDATGDALGFGKVSLFLLDTGSGTYSTGASFGFEPGERAATTLTVDELDLLLQPELETAGCYVITGGDVQRMLPHRPPSYRSVMNGNGPDAWSNHSLFVPLHDTRGLRIGFMWVDDPGDRLVPGADRLQLLRTFANQATTALATAAQHTAVRDSEEGHRAIIDASPVAIIDFDFDGVVRTWNTAAAEMFGWRTEEAVGRVNPTVQESERRSFLGNLERIRNGETMRDLRLTRQRRDGTEIEVSVNAGPIRNGRGDVVGAVSLIVDVSERTRWEAAMRASEARKDAILRSALDCVVTVDADGLIVEFNPAAEEMLGWARSDAVARRLTEIAIAEEHRAELEVAFASGSGPLLDERFEVAALRADRRRFPAEVAVVRVDVPGPPLYAVSIRDVTKRKERDGRLRDAEAKYDALVGQLPIATYVTEPSLPVRRRSMSPQIEDLLGFPATAWLDPEFFWTRVHADDLDRVREAVEAAHRSGEPLREEYRIVAANGDVVWVRDEMIAVRDTEYRPLFMHGILLDVTEPVAGRSGYANAA